MAGEDKRYTSWIRTQPCAVCGTTFGVQPHHALYGTTYSPDEARPAKALEGARKGMAQRSHDYFAVPLCMKCHIPGIHKLGGFFDGWSRAQANEWEEAQVHIHRNRYATQCPTPATPGPARAKSKRIGAGWTVATILDWCRREAPTRQAAAADALTELANLLECDVREY